MRDAIASQAVGSIFPQMLLEGGVLALLILHFGGTEADVGVNATLYNLCMVAGLLVIPYLETHSRKRILYRWLTASAFVLFLLFLAFPVSRVAGDRAAIWFVVGVTFLFGIAANVGSSAWMPYLSHLVPRSIRGRFFGSLRTWWRLTSFVGTVTAGWILGKEPGQLEFSLAFGIGAFCNLFYGYYLRRLPETPPERAGQAESVLANARAVLADTRFRRFLAFIFLVYFVQSAATPFAVPFLKRSLGFPSSFSVYSASSIAVGAIVSLLLWGRISDRFGSRLVFIASLLLTALSLSVIALVPHYATAGVAALAVAAVGFLLLGIGVSGMGIGYTIRMMLEAPAGFSGTAMALCRTTVGIATSIAPALAGFLLAALGRLGPGAAAGTADSWRSALPQRVYFLSVALFLAASTLAVKLLRHIGEGSARSIVRTAIRGGRPGQA